MSKKSYIVVIQHNIWCKLCVNWLIFETIIEDAEINRFIIKKLQITCTCSRLSMLSVVGLSISFHSLTLDGVMSPTTHPISIISFCENSRQILWHALGRSLSSSLLHASFLQFLDSLLVHTSAYFAYLHLSNPMQYQFT